jgi:hypothetical protein
MLGHGPSLTAGNTLEPLQRTLRKKLNPKEAYNMVPGRDPENWALLDRLPMVSVA